MLKKTKKKGDDYHLKKWRADNGEKLSNYISEESRNNGTLTHHSMEEYLNNRAIPHMSIPVRGHFYQLADLVQDVTAIYATEVKLYHDTMKLGGTADVVCQYDNKLTILDYKTKTSVQKDSYLKDYYLQLTCYGEMWEHLTGKKVEQIVLLISTIPGFSQVFVKDPSIYKEELSQRVEKFNSM